MKWFSFAHKESDAERYSLLESAATLVSEMTESVLTPADVDLALEDRGWLHLANASNIGEMSTVSRRSMIGKSRLYWHRDPLVKQAVRIWTDYSINTGMTFQVQEDADAVSKKQDRQSRITQLAQAVDPAAQPPTPPDAADPGEDDPAVQAAQLTLETFWNDRRNRGLTSREGQRKLSKRLLVDGEVFIGCFDLTDGKVIRKISALEITDLIKDPDDSDCVLAYRRAYMVGTKEQVKYYRNLMVTDEEFSAIDQVKAPNNETITVEPDVLVYHVPFDTITDRGNPLASSSIDWAREHRKFMESRVAIVQALAKFAHKLTAKGGQAALDKIRKSLESSFTSGIGTGVEKNPKPVPGGTWLQNEAVNVEQMPRSTGAGDSKNDGDQLKLMHCAGTGIMLHYFGDPSTGNLATATTMELPMLKQFEAYQAQWADVWRDIFSWVLNEDATDEESRSAIDIDYPYMVQKDLNILSQAINNFTTAFPELKVDAVITLILTSLGINNTDEVLDMIELKRQEVQQQEAQKAQQAHEQAMALVQTKQQPAKPLSEAIDDLVAALESNHG